jgi:RimJ/RimL family protein N-acetyltransferase
MRLRTERLDLVAMTAECAPLAAGDPRALADALSATVPDDWPPEHIDAPTMAFIRDKLTDPVYAGWWPWFVLRRNADGTRRLVGIAAYKGPPDVDGQIEVGYSVVPSEQRQGYATEAVAALIDRAREIPGVRRIIGETLPHLTPSIRVMEKLGFKFVGPGSEDGVVRYELVQPGAS